LDFREDLGKNKTLCVFRDEARPRFGEHPEFFWERLCLGEVFLESPGAEFERKEFFDELFWGLFLSRQVFLGFFFDERLVRVFFGAFLGERTFLKNRQRRDGLIGRKEGGPSRFWGAV